MFVFQLNGATYKSETKFSGGGVGRNIAEGLEKLNGAVSLISAFGRDQNGDFLRKTLSDEATFSSWISDTSPTANCAVILDRHGDCKLVVGDMTIHREITPDLVRSEKEKKCVRECSNFNLNPFPSRLTKMFRGSKSHRLSASTPTYRTKPSRRLCCWLKDSENQVSSTSNSIDFAVQS